MKSFIVILLLFSVQYINAAPDKEYPEQPSQNGGVGQYVAKEILKRFGYNTDEVTQLAPVFTDCLNNYDGADLPFDLVDVDPSFQQLLDDNNITTLTLIGCLTKIYTPDKGFQEPLLKA